MLLKSFVSGSACCRQALISAVALMFTAPWVAGSQGIVSAGAGVERTLSYNVQFNAPVAPGCSLSSTSAVSATESVTCTSVPGVIGSAFGSATTAGVLRASASLSANGLVLGQSGTPTSVLSAVGRANFFDVVGISPLTTLMPTSFTLFVNWDGNYSAPASLPTGVFAYNSSFLGFFAAGFDPLARGWSGWTRSLGTLPNSALIDEQGNGKFVGSASRSTLSGTTTTTINGLSSFINIPITSANFNFSLGLVAETMFQNLSGAAVNLSGLLSTDFSSTATITGFQVFSGTTDISNQVSVTFASGFNAPIGAPTTVPEPQTLVLVAFGLAAAAMIRRRNKAAK